MSLLSQPDLVISLILSYFKLSELPVLHLTCKKLSSLIYLHFPINMVDPPLGIDIENKVARYSRVSIKYTTSICVYKECLNPSSKPGELYCKEHLEIFNHSFIHYGVIKTGEFIVRFIPIEDGFLAFHRNKDGYMVCFGAFDINKHSSLISRISMNIFDEQYLASHGLKLKPFQYNCIRNSQCDKWKILTERLKVACKCTCTPISRTGSDIPLCSDPFTISEPTDSLKLEKRGRHYFALNESRLQDIRLTLSNGRLYHLDSRISPKLAKEFNIIIG